MGGPGPRGHVQRWVLCEVNKVETSQPLTCTSPFQTPLANFVFFFLKGPSKLEKLQVLTTFRSILDVAPGGWDSACPQPSLLLDPSESNSSVFLYPNSGRHTMPFSGYHSPWVSYSCRKQLGSPKVQFILSPLPSFKRTQRTVLFLTVSGHRGLGLELPLPSSQAPVLRLLPAFLSPAPPSQQCPCPTLR